MGNIIGNHCKIHAVLKVSSIIISVSNINSCPLVECSISDWTKPSYCSDNGWCSGLKEHLDDILCHFQL